MLLCLERFKNVSCRLLICRVYHFMTWVFVRSTLYIWLMQRHMLTRSLFNPYYWSAHCFRKHQISELFKSCLCRRVKLCLFSGHRMMRDTFSLVTVTSKIMSSRVIVRCLNSSQAFWLMENVHTALLEDYFSSFKKGVFYLPRQWIITCLWGKTRNITMPRVKVVYDCSHFRSVRDCIHVLHNNSTIQGTLK